MEIREILTELGYKLRDYGKQYRAKPIYRHSDNDTSLMINKRTGWWTDFSTQLNGPFEELIRITLNLKDKKAATDWLKKKDYSVEIKSDGPLIKQPKVFNHEMLKELFPIHDYWVGRGIAPETISQFQGGVCYEGQLKGRYVFPIFDSKSQIVGWSGRDLAGSSERPKWKHLGSVERWCYPTFLNFKLVFNKKQIILIESIGDMLKLWQAGIKNTLVIFGLNLGGYRTCFLIKMFPKSIIIALNNDTNKESSGQKAAKNIEKQLRGYFDQNIIRIHLPPKKDFGEMNVEEILEWKKGLDG